MLRISLRPAIENFARKTGIRMTYRLLAERTGLSEATIESLATRVDYNPTLATISRLCEALQCGPSDLLHPAGSAKNENRQRTRRASAKRRV